MTNLIPFELFELLEEKGYPFKYINIGDVERVPINIPTLAEVVMWVYNTHQIWVHAAMSYNEFCPHIEMNWNNKGDCISSVLELMRKKFASPDAALTAGIKYSLINLTCTNQ